MVMETFLLHEFRAWSFQSPIKFRVSLFLSPFQSFVSFQIQIDVKGMTCFLVYWVKSSLLVISLISMGSPNFILLLLPKIFLVYQIDLRAFFFLQRMNPKRKKRKKKEKKKKKESLFCELILGWVWVYAHATQVIARIYLSTLL